MNIVSSSSAVSQLPWAISSLENEQYILNRLLYRNNNQHGKTKLFTQLKALNNHLKVLTVDRIKQINTNIDVSIRSAAQHKMSQLDLMEILSNKELLHEATQTMVSAVQWSSTASQNLIKLLASKIFVPLYSLLLALLARINKCAILIALHFRNRHSALSDLIKVTVPFSLLKICH